MTDPLLADQKLYKVSWRNKMNGAEGYEDFIPAKDMIHAMALAKRSLKKAGWLLSDIEITSIGVRA